MLNFLMNAQYAVVRKRNPQRKERKMNGIWVTKDKKEIPISKLSDRHLKSIIDLLIRNSEKIRQARLTNLYNMSMMVSGEMAELDIDNQIEYLENDPDPVDYVPQLGELLAELELRQ